MSPALLQTVLHIGNDEAHFRRSLIFLLESSGSYLVLDIRMTRMSGLDLQYSLTS